MANKDSKAKVQKKIVEKKKSDTVTKKTKTNTRDKFSESAWFEPDSFSRSSSSSMNVYSFSKYNTGRQEETTLERLTDEEYSSHLINRQIALDKRNSKRTKDTSGSVCIEALRSRFTALFKTSDKGVVSVNLKEMDELVLKTHVDDAVVREDFRYIEFRIGLTWYACHYSDSLGALPEDKIKKKEMK